MTPPRELVVERRIGAPLPLVWRCLTEPKDLARWWVPDPVRIAHMDLELVPGGRFAYEMILPDGARLPMSMMILAAEPLKRLVFTDLMTEGFHPVAKPMFGFAAELALSAAPGGTLYRATARHARAEDAARHAEMGFHDGWGTVAEQLDAFAQDLDHRSLIISRLIKAPVGKVMRCWTDPAILPRWFGPAGFVCKTREIDLREGGQWRFDMEGQGQVFPNRHRYSVMREGRIEFLMDNDADSPPMEVLVNMVPEDGGTRVTQMVLLPGPAAKAAALGYQADLRGAETLAKLAALAEAA